jgi:hypothetical protein
MPRNAFRFGEGGRNTFRAADHYRGSQKGADTLDSLTLVKCSCGHSNVVDRSATQLRAFCAACSAEIS